MKLIINFFNWFRKYLFFNMLNIIYSLYVIYLMSHFMSQVEFLLSNLFGFESFFLFRIIRIFELFIFYRLNEKYNLFFRNEKIIVFHFFEIFLFFFFLLIFYYFVLRYPTFYWPSLPLLYLVFISTSQQKNKIYDKILFFMNRYNFDNPQWLFIRPQLDFFFYIILLAFVFLLIEDLLNLNDTELFWVLGFEFLS